MKTFMDMREVYVAEGARLPGRGCETIASREVATISAATMR
jgi:hypothetical protein